MRPAFPQLRKVGAQSRFGCLFLFLSRSFLIRFTPDFRRWNERLFEEMYGAFDNGRTRKDPSIDWYQGEIWFFDNCVIPLAQRIKDVGVFGVQGEDCLRNAISNKKEWTIKGNDIVKELVRKFFENKKNDDAKGSPDDENKTNETKEEEAEREKEAALKQTKESRDKHMVEWNVDLCKRMLRQILAHRMASGQDSLEGMKLIAKSLKEGSTVRDEVSRIISFPDFDKKASKLIVDPEAISLSKSVEDQLRDYVAFIASMYRDIPFHNFKHASNVSMAANKYIQRIADESLKRQMDHPLAQFGIIFSALVHDVDHTGVPNALLVKEKQRAALLYKNKSVAEQNSVDLAWTVLMDAGYKDLQGAIYSNQEEFDLFRSTIINAVMATDLFDEELIADRNKRWAQAFDPAQRDQSLSVQEFKNLRATIVMEHVMQVADIGHTSEYADMPFLTGHSAYRCFLTCFSPNLFQCNISIVSVAGTSDCSKKPTVHLKKGAWMLTLARIGMRGRSNFLIPTFARWLSALRTLACSEVLARMP